MCSIKVEVFSAFEVLLRPFTGLFSSSYSSRGSRVSHPGVDRVANPVRLSVGDHSDASGEWESPVSSASSVGMNLLNGFSKN